MLAEFKDWIQILATITGVAFTLLSIGDRLKRPRVAPQTEESRKPTPGLHQQWGFHLTASHLFVREILPISCAGLLLNYVGLSICCRLNSIVYLDMTGTAFTALLLGPWWGAIVGLLSNSLVNSTLFPNNNADLIIFPWSLVNMVGGLYWGTMARTFRFRKYIESPDSSWTSDVWYLVTFGVAGACLMSIPGAATVSALGKGDTPLVGLDPKVGTAMDELGRRLAVMLQSYLVGGPGFATSAAPVITSWFATSVRYLPDKTLCVAIALAVVRYGFPVFEEQLLRGDPTREPIRDTWVYPATLGLLYLPTYYVLTHNKMYILGDARYWILWASPWIFISIGTIMLCLIGPALEQLQKEKIKRERIYETVSRSLLQVPAFAFSRGLNLAALMATVTFVVCLPLFVQALDFYRVTFNFFVTVYGFLLAMRIFQLVIGQNLYLARSSLNENAVPDETGGLLLTRTS